jgi:transposase-like protein
MTSTKGRNNSTLSIQTDSQGHLRPSPEQREVLLDEFERSGLSVAQFAKQINVGYSTLAHWRHKRDKRRSGGATHKSSPLRLVEAVVSTAPVNGCLNTPVSLNVQLPGGARIELNSQDQLPLAAGLLQQLHHRSC